MSFFKGHEKFLDKIKRDLDFGRRSDHLLVAQIITQWEMACRQERGKRFAQENYLSHSILELLRLVKYSWECSCNVYSKYKYNRILIEI